MWRLSRGRLRARRERSTLRLGGREPIRRAAAPWRTGDVAELDLFAVPAFFALIGVELWLCRRRGRRGYRFSDALANLSCGVGRAGHRLRRERRSSSSISSCSSAPRSARLPEGALWSWAACFVAVDFCYYWWHRAEPRVNFCGPRTWSTTRARTTTSPSRCGRAAPAGLVLAVLLAARRARLPRRDGRHDVHAEHALSVLDSHAARRQARAAGVDPEHAVSPPRAPRRRLRSISTRTTAAMLIVWDRLFGTFCAEGAPPRYGVVQPLASFSALRANVDPWRRLARMAAAEPRLSGKLLVWFRPPEWRLHGDFARRGPAAHRPGLRPSRRGAPPPGARARRGALPRRRCSARSRTSTRRRGRPRARCGRGRPSSSRRSRRSARCSTGRACRRRARRR